MDTTFFCTPEGYFSYIAKRSFDNIPLIDFLTILVFETRILPDGLGQHLEVFGNFGWRLYAVRNDEMPATVHEIVAVEPCPVLGVPPPEFYLSHCFNLFRAQRAVNVHNIQLMYVMMSTAL